jgi:hypothetical protein
MSVGSFTHLGRRAQDLVPSIGAGWPGKRCRFSAMMEDTDAQPLVPPAGDRDAESSQLAPGAPGGGSTVDEMSECSFPASDPPAVWTWEPKLPRPETRETPVR